MFVKVCGLRSADDVAAAVEAGADAVGFVFTTSLRQVSPRTVRRLIRDVPPEVTTVAVFHDEPLGAMRRAVMESGVSAVQSCSQDPSDYACLQALQVRLIRAAAAAGMDLRPGACAEDLLVVDPGTHDLCCELAGAAHDRWILSGRLDPDNVAETITALRPWGVDVSAGVEARRGLKDPDLIWRFVRSAKSAASSFVLNH